MGDAEVRDEPPCAETPEACLLDTRLHQHTMEETPSDTEVPEPKLEEEAEASFSTERLEDHQDQPQDRETTSSLRKESHQSHHSPLRSTTVPPTSSRSAISGPPATALSLNVFVLCINHRTMGLWSAFLGESRAVWVARLRLLSVASNGRLKLGYEKADLFDYGKQGLTLDSVLNMRGAWNLTGVKLKFYPPDWELGDLVRTVKEAHPELRAINLPPP